MSHRIPSVGTPSLKALFLFTVDFSRKDLCLLLLERQQSQEGSPWLLATGVNLQRQGVSLEGMFSRDLPLRICHSLHVLPGRAPRLPPQTLYRPGSGPLGISRHPQENTCSRRTCACRNVFVGYPSVFCGELRTRAVTGAFPL